MQMLNTKTQAARKCSDTGGKICLAKYLEFTASRTCLKGSKFFYAWSLNIIMRS